MILVDFSSIIHRMMHTSISQVKPAKVDGKYITADFVGLMKYYIFQELFAIKQEHGPNFGEIVICLDKSSTGYWRKEVYPGYKARRKRDREESDIDFKEVFAHVDALIDQIKTNLPWRVVEVPTAEADDIMLVLAREFNGSEKILIHSPDKDMIQAQRNTDQVFQYSGLTKKWLVPENKHEHMDHWIQEHVCLGDSSDDVPKVVDHTEFTKTFIDWIGERGYNINTPMEFKAAPISNDIKRGLIEDFDIYKTDRKGESIGVKDIYKDIRFGPSTLVKAIAKAGSLDAWLDSHPLYRQNYERNFKLIMEEGIPTEIWNKIVLAYKTAETDYRDKEFEQYLTDNGLQSILLTLPGVFKITRDLTADDFGW